MGLEKAGLRWGVEQRLEFIEFRLFWEGQVDRGDLMDAFGVSVNQASTDLNRYIGMAPDNMVYDKSARAYIRGSTFDPMFLKPDASRYLSQLRSVADGILDRANAWIGQFPILRRRTNCPSGGECQDAAFGGRSNPAIRGDRGQVPVTFRPEPRWRWIAPTRSGSTVSAGTHGPSVSPIRASRISCSRGSSRPAAPNRARSVPMATPTGTSR